MASTLNYERVDMQSAQVISKITDLSRIESTTPEYAAVAVITASKGPMNVATLLESTDDLIEKFGYPTGDFVQLLGVYKILEGGVPVWVVRVCDPQFVNTSTCLVPSLADKTVLLGQEGYTTVDKATKLATRDELLETEWFSDVKTSGPDAGEHLHAFPKTFFIPDQIKETPDSGTNTEVALIGVAELVDNKFNIGFKFKVKVANGSEQIAKADFDLSKLTVTISISETVVFNNVQVSKLMLDKGVSLEKISRGDEIEFVVLGEVTSSTTAVPVTVTMAHNGTTITLTDDSSIYSIKSFVNIDNTPEVSVVDAVAKFAMKEEGTYGDYYTLRLTSLPSTSKTVEIMQKTYPNADPDQWVNVQFINSQSGLDDNIVASLDKTCDLYIENVFVKENEDVVAVCTILQDNPIPAISNSLVAFKGGSDGNVNIEKEVVNIYATVNESNGEKAIVSVTSPAYGYIDETGNLSGMHVFLNKKIRAQCFPSLGLCDKFTYEGMKTIADEREDLTCFFDTEPNLTEQQAILSIDNACNDSEILSNQAFNCRVYWDWCYATVRNVEYLIPPSAFVTINSIDTWKNYGTWNPVAGYTHGVIDVNDVGTRLPRISSRDRLVSHRINPIYDTGNQGIQIYGNETLNYEYTDLRSAHIGATLTYIRSKIDEYTETLKFRLNNTLLWSEWTNYVTSNILNPIINAGGLQFARARMGAAFTTPEELAKRQVRGQIELQFTQDAEIFLLNYIVYSSAADTTTL